MSSQGTAADILDGLSPDARKLAMRVHQLEKEFLHVKNPTRLTDEIVKAAKELAK